MSGRSLLKQIFDNPIEKLRRTHRMPPSIEALRLYREVLKFTKEFNWKNEKG